MKQKTKRHTFSLVCDIDVEKMKSSNSLQARRNQVGGVGEGCSPNPQKVDFLATDNYSEKKVKNYKLLQIPRKLLVTLLLSPSCNAEN